MSDGSFGGRYRATLTGAGATADAPTAGGGVTARGRAGYSFWQRYWASFIGVDLPARSAAAAAHDDRAVAPTRQPTAERPADGTLTNAELDALLWRLEDVFAVGLAPAGVTAQTAAVSAVVSVADSVAADGATRFDVSLRLIPAPGRLLPRPLTVALLADRTYFVAAVSQDGIGTFGYVPAGAWSFRRIGRGWGGDSAVALPAPRVGDSLAAASTAKSGILRVVLPQASLVLHRDPGDEYLLEVLVTELADTPLIATVRYGIASGAARDLVIPVVSDGSLARLPGYSPSAPWEASAVSASAHFPGWDPERIAPSVLAAANNATRRAWRAIGEFAPGEIRDLIEAALR